MAARILVVNDTQEIPELFRMLLEGEGFSYYLPTFRVFSSKTYLQCVYTQNPSSYDLVWNVT